MNKYNAMFSCIYFSCWVSEGMSSNIAKSERERERQLERRVGGIYVEGSPLRLNGWLSETDTE
jgi:hypothetical protein